VRFFLTLLLIVLLAGAIAFYLLVTPYGPQTARLVSIPPGSSAGTIGKILKREGIVRSRWLFAAAARVRRGTLKAGTYRFDHPAPLLAVYDRLRAGDVYTIALRVPEGFNIFDIAAAADTAGLAPRQTFLDAELHDTDLIQDLSPNAPSLEGYLFPDTYKLSPDMTPRAILAEMVQHFRQEAAVLGLREKIPQTVTLASLVERETPDPADRPLVASVFDNRLARGMPLETDPSVIYAALLQNRYRGTIYQSDLKADSPYNTYMHTGLPPGPICNPGVQSLIAAMHPAQSNFLYFVSDPQNAGHSLFASTLEEHARNVAAYRRSERERHAPDGKQAAR
jgi:UPF0755 protein